MAGKNMQTALPCVAGQCFPISRNAIGAVHPAVLRHWSYRHPIGATPITGSLPGQPGRQEFKGKKRHSLANALRSLLGSRSRPPASRSGPGPDRPRQRARLVVLAAPRVGGRRLREPRVYQWVQTRRPNLAVEGVGRSDDTAGFNGLPRRSVVELASARPGLLSK